MARTTRRNFAKSLAAAGAVLPLGGLAQTAPVEPPPSPLAKAMAEVTRAQFGAHLNAEELARIESDFAGYVPFVERLRAFPLTNGDEPDFSFVAGVTRW